jgi:hypothetical protein
MYVPAGIAPGVGIDAAGAKDARGFPQAVGGGVVVALEVGVPEGFAAGTWVVE